MIAAGMTVRNTLYNIDRSFIEARYWDVRKQKYQTTIVTRFKNIIIYTPANHVQLQICLATKRNRRYESTLRLSKQRWRRIEFIRLEGAEYAYLTNNFRSESLLTPSVQN